MPTVETILHPTDFSEYSQHAFHLACSLAKDYQARLILLHVVGEAPLAEWGSEPLAAHKRGFPWPQPEDPSIRVEQQIAEGDPAAEILRLAKATNCDLIVMGTHGRTGISRWLTHSVAEEVLRNSTCPVLAVKPPLRGSGKKSERLADPAQIVDVRPLGAALCVSQTHALLHGDAVEVIRMVVPAGKKIAEHKAKGEMILHCLEGKVAFTAMEKTQTLDAGRLLYLPMGEPHTLEGIENASLLLTVLLPKH